jgi:RES domain-containing protein
MKLVACKRLKFQPINATWYRAISTEHWRTALSTAHTSIVATRFNPGRTAETPFEVLYLAENQIVALYEVNAIFGPPERAIADPHKNSARGPSASADGGIAVPRCGGKNETSG